MKRKWGRDYEKDVFDDLKKYTLDEIKVGMRVNARQLDEICDIYIILHDVKLVKDDFGECEYEGIIDSITKECIPITKENSCIVYNDSMNVDCYTE